MGLFLEIKHLMVLTGSNNYKHTAKIHKALRDSIATDKRKLTIKEYCYLESLDETEVREFLEKKGFKF